MNASIEKNTHSLTRPEIIGYMSVDVSREYHSNLSQLKYLDYVPRGKIHLDLNHGIEKAVKRTTDDNGEKITLLLKFLKNNIHYVTQDEIGWRFITYRRTLISVMCNAFNNTHVKIMASLFNNSIYLCSLETPTEMHNRLSLNGRFCAWGYKFEQYLLSDLPGIHQNIEKPVIENEEFSLFYKACLGDHKLLYGAQIDGLLVTNGTVHPPNTTDFQMNLNYLKQNSYVELKTNRLLENPRQEHNFKKYKMLRCWCQCYLANLNGLLVGYRDDNGIVTKLNYFKTEDIPKYCRNEWNPEKSLKFLDYFLSFVKSQFNKRKPDEVTSLIFDLYGSNNGIAVSECDSEIEPILPEWYIKVIKKN